MDAMFGKNQQRLVESRAWHPLGEYKGLEAPRTMLKA
jgi:hypothetical protein